MNTSSQLHVLLHPAHMSWTQSLQCSTFPKAYKHCFFFLILSWPSIFGAPKVFWKPYFSCTNTLLFSFWKACPKLDHMTNFGFHGNRFKCFKVAQMYFLQKPQTKDTVQMAIVLVFNETANTKIFCTPI